LIPLIPPYAMSIVTGPRTLEPFSALNFLIFSCSSGIFSARVSFNPYNQLIIILKIIEYTVVLVDEKRSAETGDIHPLYDKYLIKSIEKNFK
jgi:hypothetical protein